MFFSEVMASNPWLVESIEDFHFYNCPECHFKSRQTEEFKEHAMESHIRSIELFFPSIKEQDELERKTIESLYPTIQIKAVKEDPELILSDDIIEPLSDVEDDPFVEPPKTEQVPKIQVKKSRQKRQRCVCPMCFEKFQGDEAFAKHVNNAHDEWKCRVCGRLYPSCQKLRYHIRIKHKDFYVSGKFTGPISGSTPTKNGLQNQKGVNACPACLKEFSSGKDYFDHMNNGHEEWKCLQCDKVCKYADQLKSHIRNKHHKTIKRMKTTLEMKV